MEAYRDQYATLFNNGRKLVLLGVSVDPDTTLANWARETSYPGVYASDSGQVAGKAYGSVRGDLDSRNVFVIGPDGRIAHRMISFNVLSQDAYSELEKAVDAVNANAGAGGSGSS
ncbi:MAG TPA: redoxin domain-containing protein [Gemmatimonadaceae bacterium]|nr:redoxin domain-containing protein [Gemmatimonadaceae bacterium]